jgi:hypothetical protein
VAFISFEIPSSGRVGNQIMKKVNTLNVHCENLVVAQTNVGKLDKLSSLDLIISDVMMMMEIPLKVSKQNIAKV